MNLIDKDNTKSFYLRHVDKDDTDFEHIYGILSNIEKDVLTYEKETLRNHGFYFAKAPVKEVRMEWAEDNLVELTPKQADFICTMGVVIISRAMMMLNIKPSDKDEE